MRSMQELVKSSSKGETPRGASQWNAALSARGCVRPFEPQIGRLSSALPVKSDAVHQPD